MSNRYAAHVYYQEDGECSRRPDPIRFDSAERAASFYRRAQRPGQAVEMFRVEKNGTLEPVYGEELRSLLADS